MRNLQTVRNICARHNRLWDRRFNTKLPYIEKRIDPPMVQMERSKKTDTNREADNRIYNELLVLAHIMQSISPSSTWGRRVKELAHQSLKDDE